MDHRSRLVTEEEVAMVGIAEALTPSTGARVTRWTRLITLVGCELCT